LAKLDFTFPDADLPNKSMLCLDPMCTRTITNKAKVFGSYDLKDYQKIYIPGPIIVNAASSESSVSLIIARSTTVDTFVELIRENLFNNDKSAWLAIHSLDSGHPLVIDSRKSAENKATYLVELEVYSFKVLIETSSAECSIEIIPRSMQIQPESFKGTYPCSTTLSEIQIGIHKHFSNTYGAKLYVNDVEMLKAPPGKINPENLPEGIEPANLMILPISTFRINEGAQTIRFNYNYQIVLRVEYTKSAVASPSETYLYTFPLTVTAGQIYKELYSIRYYNGFWIPIPLFPASSSIPLSHYYARWEDLGSDSSTVPMLSLYRPQIPAFYYKVYGSNGGTNQNLVFNGDYVNNDKISCWFPAHLEEREFFMVVRRCLFESAKDDQWKLGEQGVNVSVSYEGNPVVFKQGEKWREVSNRVIGSHGQILEVQVKKTVTTALKLEEWLRMR